jgi:hypothetical protein
VSVTFSIRGRLPDYDDGETFVNVSNGNARALLGYLRVARADQAGDVFGSRPARVLAAHCRRALWPEIASRGDEGIEPAEYRAVRADGTPGPLVIECGRRPGYLQEKARALLVLCERAGDDGEIEWA